MLRSALRVLCVSLMLIVAGFSVDNPGLPVPVPVPPSAVSS
jgi:hypothetical protein